MSHSCASCCSRCESGVGFFVSILGTSCVKLHSCKSISGISNLRIVYLSRASGGFVPQADKAEMSTSREDIERLTWSFRNSYRNTKAGNLCDILSLGFPEDVKTLCFEESVSDTKSRAFLKCDSPDADNIVFYVLHTHDSFYILQLAINDFMPTFPTCYGDLSEEIYHAHQACKTNPVLQFIVEMEDIKIFHQPKMEKYALMHEWASLFLKGESSRLEAKMNIMDDMLVFEGEEESDNVHKNMLNLLRR